MRKSKEKYNKENIEKLVKESTSIRQILFKLNLVEAGGNYALVKRKIVEYGIDTSHFTGSGQLKGNNHSHTRLSPSEYLTCDENSHRTSHKIKKWMIRDGIREHKCENCGCDTWLNEKIPLELHHVNGVRNDYRDENLKLICPNCHALTDNYRGSRLRK